jgi:hypothetical protein
LRLDPAGQHHAGQADWQAQRVKARKDAHSLVSILLTVPALALSVPSFSPLACSYCYVEFEATSAVPAALALTGTLLKNRALEVRCGRVHPSRAAATQPTPLLPGPRSHLATRQDGRGPAACTGTSSRPGLQVTEKRTNVPLFATPLARGRGRGRGRGRALAVGFRGRARGRARGRGRALYGNTTVYFNEDGEVSQGKQHIRFDTHTPPALARCRLAPPPGSVLIGRAWLANGALSMRRRASPRKVTLMRLRWNRGP